MTPFDADRFEALRQARSLPLGRPLTVKTSTTSTNDDAMRAAKSGAPHGAVVLAEEQTAGRGRRGHRWHSAAGENLTFAVMLRPELEPAALGALTLALGLAVRDVVAAKVDARVAVKWPNDVVVDRKKLAGLLLESQIEAGRVVAVVAGIGLNVLSRELPPELAGIATSLALLGAKDVEREALLADLLETMLVRLGSYRHAGLAGVHAELERHDALFGADLRVDGLEGVGRGIAEDGALLLEDAHGHTHRVIAGTVEYR